MKLLIRGKERCLWNGRKEKMCFEQNLFFLAVIAVSLLVLWIRWENSHATYKNYDIVVKKNVYCEKTQTGRVDLQTQAERKEGESCCRHSRSLSRASLSDCRRFL